MCCCHPGFFLVTPNPHPQQGRQLIWAWLQEHPNPGGAHDYAGCISTPRALSLEGGRLVQVPLPELEGLRSGRGLRLRGIPLPHGKAW
jgi:sucrose-6-phosphate hydrolase SacC (GH32 family)